MKKIFFVLTVVFFAGCSTRNTYEGTPEFSVSEEQQIRKPDILIPHIYQAYQDYYYDNDDDMYYQNFKEGKYIFLGGKHSSFQTLESGYVRIGENLYFDGKKVDGNPSSFSVIGGSYVTDSLNVFWEGKKLKGADVQTFTIMEGTNNVLAKDKNGIYWNDVFFENSDPKTFENLEYPYVKDKNNVYFGIGSLAGPTQIGILKETDAKTFESLGRGIAKDKNHFFFYNTVVAFVDASNFQFLGSGYDFNDEWAFAKDKTTLYSFFTGRENLVQKIENVDSSECKTIAHGQDENGYAQNEWQCGNRHFFFTLKEGWKEIQKEKDATKSNYSSDE